MSESINVCFRINDNYVKYMAVLMASILKNTKSFINFYVLCDEIEERNKLKLQRLKNLGNFEIHYVKVDKEKFAEIPKSSEIHISKETNYQFLIAKLLPNIDKIISLDVDLVFDKDIKELWDIDIKDYYMGGVADQVVLYYTWTHNFPLKNDYKYVNVGVTLINCAKWREENLEEKFFENVKKYSSLLRFPDQDVLNITLQEKVKLLPPKFNLMPLMKYENSTETKEAFSNPVVIHYAGQLKPWVFPDTNYAEYFWEYARLAPFYEEIIYENIFKKIMRQFSMKNISFVVLKHLKKIIKCGTKK